MGSPGDAEAAHKRAAAKARSVLAALSRMGIDVRVIGSLATGGFGHGSDIDFLVVDCPRRLKYRIEGTVEDLLAGTPFDVVYLDELPRWKADRAMREAVDARHLR